MSYYTSSLVTVACVVCGYTGSPFAVSLHSCDVQESGGRHEDWPACGCDSDGCQTLPEHTSEYWLEAMNSGNYAAHFEPGSPEWYDAVDLDGRYGDEEDPYFESTDDCVESGWHGQSGDGTDTEGKYSCRFCDGYFFADSDEE